MVHAAMFRLPDDPVNPFLVDRVSALFPALQPTTVRAAPAERGSR
jgi:hypothetical protein